MGILETFWNWAEVWAPLIPLFILFLRPTQPIFFKPLIIYLLLAVAINLLVDISWLYRYNVPWWLDSNNYLYNLHSVVRLLCFGVMFIMIPPPYLKRIKRIVLVLSMLFIIINFLFFEDFFRYISFSSRLYAVEAGVLLFYCLLYYLSRFQEDSPIKGARPVTWVVIGLSIYVVFNFPFFLFYTTLMENNQHFAEVMWNFHNACFIILCIFIARAFYVSGN